jgi:hypothetical protein
MTDPDRQPDDTRPWERPGAVRRDVEPHRGHWLRLLGGIALILGLVSCLVFPFVLLSLPLSAVVLLLARRDLARMRAGTTDPAGRKATIEARFEASLSVAVSFLMLLCICTGVGFGIWEDIQRSREKASDRHAAPSPP